METFGNPFSKRSNPPTFSPEFLDKKKKNPSIVGAQHRRFTFTIFLDLNDQKKEEKKKERETTRSARTITKAGGRWWGPRYFVSPSIVSARISSVDLSDNRPLRTVRTDRFDRAPIVPPFLTMFLT